MVLWAVAATVVAACSLLILILYRRQVKKTCRQLAFLREHTTNLRLTGGLPFSEWEELVDGVNAILDQAREGRRTAQREEAALKEAITHLSHDIRTPLTSLDGYFQLLLQSPSAEEQQRYSAVIQSRIASLRDMLEELFTYARLQDKEAPWPWNRWTLPPACTTRCLPSTRTSRPRASPPRPTSVTATCGCRATGRPCAAPFKTW